MRITLVSDIYGERNNGTTITARRMVENLKKRGHEVIVVSSYKPYDSHEEGYVTLEKRKIPFIGKYVEVKNGVAFAALDREKLKKAIRRSDVVHFLLPFKVCRAGIKIALEYGIPFTTAFHCQPENITSHLAMMDFDLANAIFYWKFLWTFYRKARYIHCPSNFIAEQLESHGYTADKRVISNGVIPVFRKKEAVKPPEFRDKYCILFTGRYSAEKRHDLLIEAVCLSSYRDRIQLIFAGNGPLKNKIARLGEILPNKPLLSLFTEDELCSVINYCDLYVHPSDVEIEAISCVEAITCGLVPVISDSRKSATRQFALSQENLFRCGDAPSLAGKIDYWIEHYEEKVKLSARYLEFSAEFAIDNCIDRMEEMFADAIQYYTVDQYFESMQASEALRVGEFAGIAGLTGIGLAASEDELTVAAAAAAVADLNSEIGSDGGENE